MKSLRGALIIVEGVDKSGKTTFSRELVSGLISLGIDAKYLNFPDRTTQVGQAIDKYLKTKEATLNDQTIHLLFSANRWECVSTLKSLLSAGTTLVIDRYAFSGVAYSAAKGMNFDWCKSPDVGLPNPDRVYFLDLDRNTQANRDGFGDERYDILPFQEKVHSTFLKMKQENWKILNAARPTKELIGEELQTLPQFIENVRNMDLTELWK